MKSILKNNIFTNPHGWASNCIGTPFRYRLMQAITIVLGVFLIWMAVLLAKISERSPLHPLSFIAFSIWVFIGVVALPLSYLRALRHFLTR